MYGTPARLISADKVMVGVTYGDRISTGKLCRVANV